LGRAAPPEPHCAVKMAMPERRRLASGPVHAAGGAAERGAVAAQDAGRRVGGRTALRPTVVGPVLLDVAGRRAGRVAEVARERLEHLGASLRRRQTVVALRGGAEDE